MQPSTRPSATCYPGFETYLQGAEYTAALVEKDDNFITGKGPGAAMEFAFAIVEKYCGVGLWASLRDEFYSALEDVSEVNGFRNVAIATGNAAYPLICQLAAAVSDKCKNIKVDVFEISNRFFGESITVAGLVVGEDLISQLKDKLGADELLIPSVMLRHERDMFLDSITVEQAEKELNTKIIITDVDGYDLLDKILGRQGM